MSLLSLTAQWIDSSFNFQRVTLHTENFRGSHTTERIGEAIQGMLNSRGIETSWIHVLVRDNARNMKKAMNDMGVKSVGCLEHILRVSAQRRGRSGHREKNYRPFQTFPVGLLPSGKYPEGSEDGCQASTAGHASEMEQQPLHATEHPGAKASSVGLCRVAKPPSHTDSCPVDLDGEDR